MLRVVFGLAAAWLLLSVFFPGRTHPVSVGGLGGLMVGAAYIIERMRASRQQE